MKRRSAASPAPTHNRRTLLAGLLMLLAACTGGGPQSPTGLSYEEAKAQVPLEGNDREPLFWQVSPLPDPDAAAAAEAVQYHLAALYALDGDPPINEDYSDLMSHFATDERVAEVRGWFTGPKSPSVASIDYTGPRWMWIMDVIRLSDNELGVTVCVDGGWYGYHPDGVFREVENRITQVRWSLDGYVLREEKEAESSHWKVHDIQGVSKMLSERELEALREECIAWATHDWEGD